MKCETPHLYEDDIKKRFIEVCNQIATDRADFLTSCREIVILLSNTAALDKKIEAQYAHINELTVSMQEFIIVTDTFDGKLWLLLVEKATVGTDGKLTFTLRNGMEIEV
mgnify:FL=1